METDHVNIHALLAFGFPYCSIQSHRYVITTYDFYYNKETIAKSYFTLFTNTLICLGACHAFQWLPHASIVVEPRPNSMWNNE
jgi:hypothetical protein